MRPRARVPADGPAFDRVVDTAGMRALEASADAEANLMQAAGAALAAEVGRRLRPVRGRSVVVLVGPGDNGGDALILARHLSRDGAAVFGWGSRRRDDDPLVSAATAWGMRWKLWRNDASALRRDVRSAACVVDGLLGIGSTPPLRGSVAEILTALPEVPGQLRLAIDIPSGTDGDSGAADPRAFRAQATLATGPVKLGSLLHPALEVAGQVQALDIGLAEGALERVPTALIDERTVRALTPARPLNAHKGTFGRLHIVGGSARYRGAPALAAIAAGGAGVGLVTVASVEPVIAAVAAAVPAATFLPLPADAEGHLTADADETLAGAQPDALLIGPGLGRSPKSDALAVALSRLPADAMARLIDADGLNALAESPADLHELGDSAVLTPHPVELRRLLGLPEAPEGADRLAAARALAELSGAVVVAKGSPTFVCAGERTWILARPNPALATAGTGDVLAGAIAALLAQGSAPAEAARLGVWLQARAAELAASDAAVGVSAEQIARALGQARAELQRAR